LERLEEIICAKWEGIQSTIKFAVTNSPLDEFQDFELALAKLEGLMKSKLRPYEYESCRSLYMAIQNR
jgi:hypothetical protein